MLASSLVAYAIARNMHRKLFKGLFFYFISALFVPFPILMLPVVNVLQARKLIDYVGLPWDEACLSPHKQKRAVLTANGRFSDGAEEPVT